VIQQKFADSLPWGFRGKEGKSLIVPVCGETSKAAMRRVHEGFFFRFLFGKGIDIGCGADPICDWCTRWDLKDGDATLMEGLEAGGFDWVYSSHCLEHLKDPSAALARWWELLKPQGRLLLVVPDEDLYEQGVWPSQWNPDHRTTWTISKAKSWSPVSRNLAFELGQLPQGQIKYLKLCDYLYNYGVKGVDQSSGLSEVGIEAVVVKVA
jgi:SAM-dependent methyltransferase